MLSNGDEISKYTCMYKMKYITCRLKRFINILQKCIYICFYVNEFVLETFFVTFHSNEMFNKWIKCKRIILCYLKCFRNGSETLQLTQ